MGVVGSRLMSYFGSRSYVRVGRRYTPFLRPFFIWNKFLCFHLVCKCDFISYCAKVATNSHAAITLSDSITRENHTSNTSERGGNEQYSIIEVQL